MLIPLFVLTLCQMTWRFSCLRGLADFSLHNHKVLDWNLGEVGVHAQEFNFDRSFS